MGNSSDLDMGEFNSDVDPFGAGPESGNSGEGGDPFNFAPPAPAGKAGKPKASEPKAPPPRNPTSNPVPPSAPAKVDPRSAGLTADVPIQLVAVMGKKTITIKEILSLSKGQVIELNRFPNEAIDLVANGKLMAKGELVEIDGKLGVRIIKIFE